MDVEKPNGFLQRLRVSLTQGGLRVPGALSDQARPRVSAHTQNELLVRVRQTHIPGQCVGNKRVVSLSEKHQPTTDMG